MNLEDKFDDLKQLLEQNYINNKEEIWEKIESNLNSNQNKNYKTFYWLLPIYSF